MTATQTAKRTARRARDSRALEILTRVGFIGYGFFHLAIAWLALQIALGHAQGSGDQSGAFQFLHKQPAGAVLLIIIIVGLIAMAIWQLLLALLGTDTGERVMSLVRGIVYAFLAWTAYKVDTNKPASSGAQQRDVTAGLLKHPAGQWLVGLIGLIVVGVAIGMIIYGARRKFAKKLKLNEMTPRLRSDVLRLGQVGYMSKGLALGIVGVLLIDIAVFDDSARLSGMDAALRTLSQQPFGEFLLIVVALGFAAHGVYCFFQSRYRRV
jgi:Domain of Unknown Function (DUF1206)